MAAVKRKLDPKSLEPQKYAVGETCRILRPHLWHSCTGTVVSFANGFHRVKIDAKDGEAYPSGFHADVPGSQLIEFI